MLPTPKPPTPTATETKLLLGPGAGTCASLDHQITLRYDSEEWPAVSATSSPPSQLQLGSRYLASGEVGRGGMGAILRVVDQTLNRPVAMKVMLTSRDAITRQRFIEEAQITGQLEHPGIVPVHDLGTDQGGNFFFTMKLVHGISLADVLAQLAIGEQATLTAFPLARLLRILVDVSNAVAFAHHRGVIHRDLKPANVMIGRFGEVQVMDWGLAKIAGDQGATPARPANAVASPASAAATTPGDPPEQPITSSRDAAMNTLHGTIVGTPSYMPPEQASGNPAAITTRSDIYALGALLYELLTLTPPVRGGDAFVILARVVHGRIEQPERRAPARAIPGELSAIAMKALQADPRRRYQCVEDFRSDLERFLDGRAVSAKSDAPWETLGKLIRRNRTASTAIIGAAALILLVVASAFVMTEGDRRRAVHSERRALDALESVRTEQAEKERERNRRSEAEHRALPGLVLEARAAIDLDHDQEAARILDLALAIDAQDRAALLLRAELALATSSRPAAAAALADYLQAAPGDQDAQQLLELARRPAGPGDEPGRASAIATILARQGAAHLATRIANTYNQGVEILRAQLERRWPGAGDHLEAKENAELCFDARPFKGQVADLDPLHGAPLTRLDLSDCQKVATLVPLRGMPLNWLSLDQCILVTDLSPLAGMPLHHLNLRNCHRVADFSVLKGMPLEVLELSECGSFKDLTLLAGMPLRELSLRTCPLIADFTPLTTLPLMRLDLGTTDFSDAALLARIPTLRILYCGQTRVNDLAPLAQLALTELMIPREPRPAGLELLRHSATLTSINLLPVAEFWRRLDREHAVPQRP